MSQMSSHTSEHEEEIWETDTDVDEASKKITYEANAHMRDSPFPRQGVHIRQHSTFDWMTAAEIKAKYRHGLITQVRFDKPT